MSFSLLLLFALLDILAHVWHVWIAGHGMSQSTRAFERQAAWIRLEKLETAQTPRGVCVWPAHPLGSL